MKHVKRMELSIEMIGEEPEETRFLHGIEQIGREVFHAIDTVYTDMLDDPEMYMRLLMEIREFYRKDGFDEAIELMYMLAALCDVSSKIKMEAFACQSEETKEAILNGFEASIEDEYGTDEAFEEDEDYDGYENSGYL